MLDFPDELTSINTESFLGSSTNNIDQSLDVGPLSTNNTSNLTTPPINNVMNPSGNLLTNIALPGNITNQNPLLMSNATPPPNTVVSTSGDPTSTLPSVSASPIHSSPAFLTSNPVSLPGGNYQSPIHNSNVIGGVMTTPPRGPMDGRLRTVSQQPNKVLPGSESTVLTEQVKVFNMNV